MKKEKQVNIQEQGITLIALVITIIIIIILATVTINMAFGENGLISQAELARNMATNSMTFEEESMANLTAYMNEIMGEEVSGVKTLVQAFKDGEIAVGDYVDYSPAEGQQTSVGEEQTGYSEIQTFTTDMSTTWRVLGLSEDEHHLLLTSGSPIKKDGENPYLVLQGAKGYLNCENTLDTIARIYHNDGLAEETRSMRVEDIERALGGVTVEYPTASGEQGNVYFDKNPYQESIGTTPSASVDYTYKVEDYSPESASQNPPQYETSNKTIKGNAYYFAFEEAYTTFLGLSEKIWDLLFKDTTEEANYVKSYWLGTKGISTYSPSLVYFSPSIVRGSYVIVGATGEMLYYEDCQLNLFDSLGSWSAYASAVRPVVVLKSDITLEQLHKIEEQVESTWSTTVKPGYVNAGTLD